MSPNAAFVLRMFQIIDTADYGRLGEVFAPEVTYHRPGFAPVLGLDDLTDFYLRRRIIGHGQHHLERMVFDGQSGVAIGLFKGALKDGVEIEEAFADAYEFGEGRILHRRTFFFRPAI